MAETYDVYWGTDPGNLSLIESGISELQINMPIEGVLNYNRVYYWRVDAIDDFGTTTGDTWSFTTIVFAPPLPSGITLPDEEGEKGEPTGTPTGENNMVTVKRLVAAARNRIYYEAL